jgi:hypothetical protein
MRLSKATIPLFALALAAVILLSVPAPVQAGCLCVPEGGTPNYQGFGSSCSAADTSVFNQSDTYATNFCANYGDSVCRESSVIVTVACADNGGTWSETGHILFRCEVCS